MDEGCQGRQRSGVSDAEVVDLSETRYGMLSLRALLQEEEQWPCSQGLKAVCPLDLTVGVYRHFFFFSFLTQ